MLYIHLAALWGILLFYCCYCGSSTRKIFVCQTFGPKTAAVILFAASLSIRILLAGFGGFSTDISCFAAWAERMCETGPSGFYSEEVFTDYPPAYMYLLCLTGLLRRALHIPYASYAHLILLKLPSILCDLLCGYLLYRESSGRCLPRQRLFLSCAYLLNPAVILNSAVWGQTDSVLTLAISLMCLFLVKQRLPLSWLAFFVGLLIKPQMLLFAPILLIAVWDQVFGEGFHFPALKKNILWCLSGCGVFVCLSLPFGLQNVVKQYCSTVESYPYAAVNACNLWGFLGLNWVSQENVFWGLSYRLLGYLFILAAVIAVTAIGLRRKKDPMKYPYLGALLICTLFTFSVRMHERYLYPCMLLFMMAILYRPAKTAWISYGAFSLLHFYNAAFVLAFYDPENYDRRAPLLIAVSGGILLSVAFLYLFTTRSYFGYRNAVSEAHLTRRSYFGSQNAVSEAHLTRRFNPGSAKNLSCPPRPSVKNPPLKKADLALMALITIGYSLFALYDLGDTAAPQSAYSMTRYDTLSLRFDSLPFQRRIQTMSYYMAPVHDRHFTLSTEFTEGQTTETEILLENVFTWQQIPLEYSGSENPCEISLSLEDDSASLLELVFRDNEGNIITPSNASDYPALFDEQTLCPARSSFRNSMYFDEIYHGRTAYEFLHGLPAYETTHPPLGKILISLGVSLFGMTPFGWRITGTVFGILMVPPVYLFGKKLTKRTSGAALACVLFGFDFMHFTQTRIATIDVYITFFVILMYLFMFLYCQKSFYDTSLQKTFLPLGACGICMGLGIACKWTGFYAGAGLAVLFFSSLFERYREYRYAKRDPAGESNGMSHAHILKVFPANTRRTIAFCTVFFLLLPALIYLLSYLPFAGYYKEGLFSRMWHNQIAMYDYHSSLTASHPYSSRWYEWPVIKRPVWYYSSIVTGAYQKGGIREGISAFGNPLVWWAGIPAAFFMLFLWVKKKDKTAAFLTIGYLAQYLPWFFVTRITFLYHYFPSVVFVVMMIVYGLLKAFGDKSVEIPYFKAKKIPVQVFPLLVILYGAAVFALFLLFYPVLSGQPVDAAFVDRWLRWFDSWVLTAP